MDNEKKTVIARGLKSEFWRIYVAEVLEPEKELALKTLLQHGPPGVDELPRIAYARGINAVVERLEKKLELWLA